MRLSQVLAIILCSVVSGAAYSTSIVKWNETLWERPIEVEQYSVINKSQCEGFAKLLFDEHEVVKDGYRGVFSIVDSPDDKYFVIQVIHSCSSPNNLCISDDYLMFSPKNTATLSCMKYPG